VRRRREPSVADIFPTAHARAAADKAIDDIDPALPMTAFLDAWIAAYLAAGGKTALVPDRSE